MNKIFGYERTLLMNSGSEVDESAIKFARRWGYMIKKIPKDSATMLFRTGNFMGRTIAACAGSDDPLRYENFGPYGGLNFDLVEFGSIESLRKKL